MRLTTDFIVIGSGIAGLNAALTLANFGNVTIITKQAIEDSSTNIAQGGVAAVTNPKDTIFSHINDTLKAGSFHNKKSAVSFLVKHGKTAIIKLADFGVNFDKKTTLEAAHSFPRIHHATDITGHEIEKALVAAVLKNPNISVWKHTYAIDLIAKNNICFGVTALKDKKIIQIFSRAVVLATGGAGQLYSYTTNPSVVTGDGIAISHRAGAKTKDLEFVQFHPTALKGKTSPLFLLSEALRGEGAYLLDIYGKRFINELAPRDVVARAIFKKQKEGNVYLDIRHKGKQFLIKRFPNIYKQLQKRGFDLAKDIIPVTPAAHFLCGGIVTDLYGKTSVKNLFAYGEVTCTGVHGANRLASNSLLEGIVFSNQIAKCIKKLPKKIIQIKEYIPQYQEKLPEKMYRKQVQKIMWNYVGIIRSPKGVYSALKELKKLESEANALVKNGVNEQILEAQNITQVAILITQAAQKRKKSLGAHFVA
ncbi:MAG: L-aspartate oxidase [Candidatus Levyibacteriota bacterium]|nr:MAG: L-aspartate oxidase [Candidatus Levybacteria bacterium]